MGMERIQSMTSMRINEIFLKKNSMKSMINEKKSPKAMSTEVIADRLVEIFDAPQSRNFFLKCAWHLSEDQIWTAVENSQKKRVNSPVRYFVTCCQKELAKNIV